MPSIAQGWQQLKSLAIDYRAFLFAKQPEPASTMTAGMVAPAPQPVQPMMPTRVLVAAATEEQRPKNAPPAHQPIVEQPVLQASPAQDERLNETLQELQNARQAMARKDAKISALRRDLESMRTQLETRDKELRAVKTNQQTQPKQDKRNRAELTVR
ncbi:MAG: hypothetical protein HY348_03825 [Nitrospira defluvii]|nr:hypothetical protein [Nitrospira defluvii]